MLQDDIKKALICHHIFPNKKGYKYLLYVMEYAIEGCGKTLSEIYVLVAEKCGVKPNSVEKCISDSIESSFDNAFVAEKYGFLASADNGKITNKRFVQILIDEIHNK